MTQLTESEIVEKWVRIAEKLFPPQTRIEAAKKTGGPLITVRWKDEQDPNALSKRARGVDLVFPDRVLEDYRRGDAALEVKWDSLLEQVITEKLAHYNPYNGDASQPERWIIATEPPRS